MGGRTWPLKVWKQVGFCSGAVCATGSLLSWMTFCFNILRHLKTQSHKPEACAPSPVGPKRIIKLVVVVVVVIVVVVVVVVE